jgi:hypothetical protein
MATSYPSAIDTLVNPSSSNPLSSPSHSEQHTNANDAIEALETKIGINNSSDTNSIDYKVNSLQTAVTNIGNSTTAAIELLGLEGNNDIQVYGIENITTIDTFAKSIWKSVFYKLQITKDSNVYTSDLSVVQDGNDVLVSETNILSDTNTSLFTYTFEENEGIISLRVTPVSGSISVKYYRTAIKA